MALILSLGIFGYTWQNNHPKSSALIAKEYTSIEELAKATPIVFTGRVVGESARLNYQHVTFITTKVEINEIYRDNGGLKKGDSITLLQTDMEEDPVVDKNDELLLFLKKYEGPVIDDAYLIVGLEQGHFKVKNNKMYPKSDEQQLRIYKDIQQKYPSGLALDEFKTILEKANYMPAAPRKILTEEEIKKLNEQQQKLYQERLKMSEEEIKEEIRKEYEQKRKLRQENSQHEHN